MFHHQRSRRVLEIGDVVVVVGEDGLRSGGHLYNGDGESMSIIRNRT